MSSPRPCRILVISSSTAQARELAERLVDESAAPSAAGFKDEEKTELPWTISNKYYTAQVHFFVAHTKDITGGDAADVPACIFVFSLAEPFKDDFLALTARLEHADFEVSIAVSVPAPGAAPSTDEDEREAFFAEHGFEYVDGRDAPAEHRTDRTEGIPGIARVVDALSTILWPSMVQRAGSQRRSGVPGPAPPGDDDGLCALLGTHTAAGRQREMDALERWLEDGADDATDSWAGAAHSPSLAPSQSQPAAPGFDDNFSDFVSAATRGADGGADPDPDPDPALPSRAEVAAMSQRIFDAGSADDTDVDESEGGSQAPFDLSRILGALEAMKEEIAGIADEDEKRRAAAKVALGLVYGLDDG